MTELNAEQAQTKFQKSFRSRTVHWITRDGEFWYICATDPDPEEGNMNPYFKVHARTGKLTEFFVTSDFVLFAKLRDQVAGST